MTNKQLRSHIGKIIFLKILAVLFAMATVACAVGYSYLTEHLYSLWLYPSEQSDAQSRVNTVMQAIYLRPAESQGYINILDIYTEDAVLTEKEVNQFTALLQQHQKKLNKDTTTAESVYLRFAFDCISCYNADAGTRLKTAYGYFTMAQVTPDDNTLQDTLHAIYLEIGSYCSVYLWNPGSGKIPNTVVVNDLVKQQTAMLDACQIGTERDRLAYACTLAMLLNEHNTVWRTLIDSEMVETLTQKVIQVAKADVSDPVAMRLREELCLQIEELQQEEDDQYENFNDPTISE